TGRVAEGVVDVLEAIQVEEQYREHILGRSRDCLVELPHEAVPIPEPREGIVLREVFLLGDVGRLPPQRTMQLRGECQHREYPDQEHCSRRGSLAQPLSAKRGDRNAGAYVERQRGGARKAYVTAFRGKGQKHTAGV